MTAISSIRHAETGTYAPEPAGFRSSACPPGRSVRPSGRVAPKPLRRLGIRSAALGGVGLVQLTGAADLAEADRLGDSIDGLVAAGIRSIVLNLKGVEFLSVCCLSALVRSHLHARGDGGGLSLVAPRSEIRELLTRAGLTRLLPTFDTLDEALLAAGQVG